MFLHVCPVVLIMLVFKFCRLKDLEEVMLLAIRPLLQVTNDVHNRSRAEPTDEVLAGQSKCLVGLG